MNSATSVDGLPSRSIAQALDQIDRVRQRSHRKLEAYHAFKTAKSLRLTIPQSSNYVPTG